jgi:hypothetical protein
MLHHVAMFCRLCTSTQKTETSQDVITNSLATKEKNEVLKQDATRVSIEVEEKVKCQ